MGKENRNSKDSVFTDLFYSDQYAKRNLLSLYNALSGDHLTDENAIRQVRLEDVLFKDFQNDISFLVRDRRIILGEHQSTVNRNMPLRYLMYIGREYEQIVDPDSRYKRNLVKIPTPEFVTFYNGEEKLPAETVLKLSDAFRSVDENLSLELKVRVININPSSGHSILDACGILKEYSLFVDEIRRQREKGNGLKEAVLSCLDAGILQEYLSRKSSEVVNMLMAEYDYETDIRVQREESREEGRELGREELRSVLKKVREFLRKEPGAGKREIALACGCTEDEAEEAIDFLKSLL